MPDASPLPIVIVGAGAAGLMAAICAAGGPRPVLLLEGSDRPGQKILISGGGRCNILPSAARPDDFFTGGSRHSLRNILAAWPLAEVRRFFEHDLGLPLKLEEGTDKLFPVADRSRAVLDALLAAIHAHGVTLRQNARVTGLHRSDPVWRLQLASGEEIAAARVVLATGGLSVPATGSDGAGLQMAEALGHSLTPVYPALTPLLGDAPAHAQLAGVSLRAALSAPHPSGKGVLRTEGGFLFTHRGYSGPAVLNIAHAAVLGGPATPIRVQWTPYDFEAWDVRLQSAHGPVTALLRRDLPERLAAALLAEWKAGSSAGAAAPDPVNLSQLRRDDRRRLAELLARYPLPWTGHEGYRVAEVTGGGVALSEVNPSTLESRVAPGLHLCGEMLDAFGPIGGYNFLWAWVTGRSAGLACRG